METCPTKGPTAYDLTDTSRLYRSGAYDYYKIIRKDNKKEYCLRELGRSDYRHLYEKDLEILLEANHPFIVKYIDHFIKDEEKPCIVTDCISSQKLSDLIEYGKKIFS